MAMCRRVPSVFFAGFRGSPSHFTSLCWPPSSCNECISLHHTSVFLALALLLFGGPAPALLQAHGLLLRRHLLLLHQVRPCTSAQLARCSGSGDAGAAVAAATAVATAVAVAVEWQWQQKWQQQVQQQWQQQYQQQWQWQQQSSNTAA